MSIDAFDLLAFRLQDAQLLLTLNAYDASDRLVMKVKDDELVYSASPWDIEFVGRNLIIREAHRKILLDLVFAPPDKVIIQRGHFLRDSVEIYIRPTYAVVVNHTLLLQDFGVTDFARGLAIGTPHDSLAPGLSIPVVERNLSSSERNHRLREAVRLVRAHSSATSTRVPIDGTVP